LSPPTAAPAAETICVVGGGTIGSLFAAHLARLGEVWVLTRRSDHAAAIRSDGITVTGKSQFVARLQATADPGELPPFGLAIVATKATELGAAVSQLSQVSPDAVLMTCQNGLGADAVVARGGPWPVLSSVTFMSGTRHSDTHVEYELDAPTWLGPSPCRPAPAGTADDVAKRLVGGGLKAQAFDDVQPALWSKLIFNATVNSVAALTQLPHDRHFRETAELGDLGHLVRALVEEGRAVAEAAGVTLHEDPWAMNLEAVRRGETGQGRYRHLPSMLEDVLASRPTEVDFITGALVRQGLEHGVPVPLHLALYRLVKAREAAFAASELT